MSILWQKNRDGEDMQTLDLYAVNLELHTDSGVKGYPPRYTFATNEIEAVQKIRANYNRRNANNKFDKRTHLKMSARRWEQDNG